MGSRIVRGLGLAAVLAAGGAATLANTRAPHHEPQATTVVAPLAASVAPASGIIVITHG